MSSLVNVSELEWMGFEVAAARLLGAGMAASAVLRCIVERAPGPVQYFALHEAAAASVALSRCRSEGHACKVHVCRLRSAAEDLGLELPIRNVRGLGYMLAAADAAGVYDLVVDSVVRPARSRAA